ncbi:MAG: 2-oxo acid dehydrogenase subunit E2 [Clostridiaceae bacterium]|nr:2-oxo acid dehydrogenase subunit E2 [Clostridiaceae bacterium]
MAEEKCKRRFGDRKEAYLIRDGDAYHALLPHLMPHRADAECYLHKELDVTGLLEWIKARNEANDYKTTIFHTFIYMISKVITERPLLNRYVSGRKFFQRYGISLSFVVKKQFSDTGEETLMVLRPTENFTLADVSRKINGEVHEMRTTTDKADSEDVFEILQKLPRPIMMFTMWILRTLDFYGKLPNYLESFDTNHTTVLLSNLGSVGCDAVYHHLNNFGTNSLMITIGEIRHEYRLQADGSVKPADILPVGMTVDERIADGFYFAKSIRLLDYLVAHPELMDMPLSKPSGFQY